MGALGLPVHDFGEGNPGLNQAQAFYNLNALVLSAFGIAAIAVVLALRRRRPWDAAMFALAPALVRHGHRELGPLRGRAHRVLPVRLGRSAARCWPGCCSASPSRRSSIRCS